MIDEKRLIKELEELRDHAANTLEQCELGTVEHFSYMMQTSAYNTAISICEDMPKVGGWIPVEEDQPPDSDEELLYFVCRKYKTLYGGEGVEVDIASYLNNTWCNEDGEIDVISWMSIPEQRRTAKPKGIYCDQ